MHPFIFSNPDPPIELFETKMVGLWETSVNPRLFEMRETDNETKIRKNIVGKIEIRNNPSLKQWERRTIDHESLCAEGFPVLISDGEIVPTK